MRSPRRHRRRLGAVLALLIGLVAAVLVWQGGYFEPSFSDAVRVEADIVYAFPDNQPLRLDAYLPPSSFGFHRRRRAPLAAVVLLHGGSWMYGSKRQTAETARALARAGFAAFAVDYRLLTPDGKNRLPDQIADARAAVRWARAHAARFGLRAGGKIGVWGFSSGGHLAALLGVLSPQVDGVGAVVETAGPSDFSLPTAFPPLSPQEMPVLPNLLGKTYTEAPALWRDASPACRVTPNAAPFLIFHGTDDDVVPPMQSERMFAALRRAGADATLVRVWGESHVFVQPENLQSKNDQTVGFLRRCLVFKR